MGSSSSKAARTAAGAAARKYPSRTTVQPSTSQPGNIGGAENSPSHISPTSQPPPASPISLSLNSQVFPSENQPGPTVHSKARPSATRTDEINLDARDPHLASRLTELGPVKPYPTFSPSSTSAPGASNASDQSIMSPFGSGVYPAPGSNPAIVILTARSRIQQAVEQEKINAGRAGFEGREYLDIATIRKVLTLRDEQGMNKDDIEKALRLKKGTVNGLGRIGVFEAA